jgi:PAS domain S-box-containing protein
MSRTESGGRTKDLDYRKQLRTLALETRALQQNEERWRTAFESSVIGMMMADATGRYFAANEAFQKTLGYTESELCQLSFAEVTYEEDRQLNLELVNELLEGKRQHFQIEKRYRRKDGTLVWARTNVVLVPGVGTVEPFWFGIVEDISERKRVEGALRESEGRLKAFCENSPNLIFLKDRQGRYLYVNKEFERALRVTDEQIRGKTDDEIFSVEQARAFQANDQKVFEAGVAMEFEEVALQHDGQHTNIVQKFPLVNSEGNAYAIGGIVTDITRRKRAESELLTLQDELTAELTAMTRLHEFSTHLLAFSEFQPLLQEVLEATIVLHNADFGNIQIYNPETHALEIVAHSGFQRDFLDYLTTVQDIGETCARAMQLRQRVMIEDVEKEFEYAPHRDAAAAAGFRALQSTPLFSRSREFLGILSTYFRQPHRLSKHDLRLTDVYVGHANEILERQRLETARREAQQALQMMQVRLARVSGLTSVGEPAASIAQEVKQPLTALINNSNGCLRLLTQRDLDPAVLRRDLEEIIAQGDRALDSIRIALERDLANRKREGELKELRQRFESLTAREREVISMVVSGMLNKQIASQLRTAENTVKVHRSRAMEKMQAQSLADLVRMIDKLQNRV